jgi:hypothetical protein
MKDPAAGGLEPAPVTVDEIIACLGTRPHPEDQLGAPCSVQTTLLTVLLTARQASWSRTSNAIIRPDTSCNIESWGGRGRVLRASISFVVIGFAASIQCSGRAIPSATIAAGGLPTTRVLSLPGLPTTRVLWLSGLPTPSVLSGQSLSAVSGRRSGRRRGGVR